MGFWSWLWILVPPVLFVVSALIYYLGTGREERGNGG